jgi:hypothetical protein
MEVIIICLILLFVVFLLFRNLQDKKLLESVTQSNRGTRSERELVLAFLKSGTPAHAIFHDLYLETQKDNFSQTDLAIVTNVGIIVFEVKDYSGWIFGSGNKSQWTQVLAYGKQKYSFYNPIFQNNKHIVELRRKINFEEIPFYSIIVFYGDCVFKQVDFIPDGTFLVKSNKVLNAVKTIMDENPEVHYNNVDDVFKVLGEAAINGGILENQIRHKENISSMLGMHRIFD